jgi:hypothetical protein
LSAEEGERRECFNKATGSRLLEASVSEQRWPCKGMLESGADAISSQWKPELACFGENFPRYSRCVVNIERRIWYPFEKEPGILSKISFNILVCSDMPLS